MYSIWKGLVDDKMEARINFRNILDKMIETSSEASKRSSVKHVNLRSRISVNDFTEFGQALPILALL